MSRRTWTRALCALAVLTAAPTLRPSALVGQADQGTFVAIPADFPDVDARAVVVREPGRSVVLLRASDMGLDVLAMALFVLRRASEAALAPGTGQMIPITGFVMTEPPRGDRKRRLEQVLRRLERAPLRGMGTLGTGRWVRWR